MKNVKTTIGGWLAAIGIGMQAVDNSTIKLIGVIINAVGTIILGHNAQDSK